MYVLDTNTLIYFFRGQGKVGVRLLAVPPSEVAIPAISVFELETGIANLSQPARRRRQFDELLEVITVLPFDRSAAIAAASVRTSLEKTGRPIGPMDTLIAGIALAHRATLVTHNTREFKRVPKLSIADWYD